MKRKALDLAKPHIFSKTHWRWYDKLSQIKTMAFYTNIKKIGFEFPIVKAGEIVLLILSYTQKTQTDFLHKSICLFILKWNKLIKPQLIMLLLKMQAIINTKGMWTIWCDSINTMFTYAFNIISTFQQLPVVGIHPYPIIFFNV